MRQLLGRVTEVIFREVGLALGLLGSDLEVGLGFFVLLA